MLIINLWCSQRNQRLPYFVRHDCQKSSVVVDQRCWFDIAVLSEKRTDVLVAAGLVAVSCGMGVVVSKGTSWLVPFLFFSSFIPFCGMVVEDWE